MDLQTDGNGYYYFTNCKSLISSCCVTHLYACLPARQVRFPEHPFRSVLNLAKVSARIIFLHLKH
jgi:hypothetical protein